jgi:hypothetical protein
VFLHKSFFHIKQGKETLVRGTITKRWTGTKWNYKCSKWAFTNDWRGNKT